MADEQLYPPAIKRPRSDEPALEVRRYGTTCYVVFRCHLAVCLSATFGSRQTPCRDCSASRAGIVRGTPEALGHERSGRSPGQTSPYLPSMRLAGQGT